MCTFVTQKKEVRSRSRCGTEKRTCKKKRELARFVLVFFVPFGTALVTKVEVAFNVGKADLF